MSLKVEPSAAAEDRQYHTYTTHRIPWYVRLMWVAFWVAMIWYILAYAVPAAKTYF
ncbi:MAG: hypothetical protein FLDDKLPJ_03090 [Phycisphaerae bacterium]|nr:hypothetical protein [Planctomycetia bacterium]MCG3132257.1 hypothetical protein [Phycisphaerae bacterium]GIK15750.1 MAG: hypothetical protein BroJett003_07140 [Planctomycetota bacterium]MCK6466249.1 hypothetical protein [Phycisphaerae bacterium]MCL4719998.1 hypothetical protein [Phycisphaerae bacterium]